MKKHSTSDRIKPITNPKEYTPVSVCRDFAIIEFDGIFMEHRLLWRAEIRTLAHHCRLLNISATPMQQFIDVSLDIIDINSRKASLILGLNLKEINHAAILSSMILIRQYKNLKVGLHQYGEMIYNQ